MDSKPKIHFHDELREDINDDFISNEILLKWFNDSYSTSKHLLTLFSIIKGLNATNILEIGFGRSTFVLAKAIKENQGYLTTCDMEDFSYLLSKKEKSNVKYIHGKSSIIWENNEFYDFAFLDYFSDKTVSFRFCYSEIQKCLKKMKTNGIIAVHDTFVEKYKVKKVLFFMRLIHNIEITTLPFNYGLSLIRKTGKSKGGILNDNFIKKTDLK